MADRYSHSWSSEKHVSRHNERLENVWANSATKRRPRLISAVGNGLAVDQCGTAYQPASHPSSESVDLAAFDRTTMRWMQWSIGGYCCWRQPMARLTLERSQCMLRTAVWHTSRSMQRHETWSHWKRTFDYSAWRSGGMTARSSVNMQQQQQQTLAVARALQAKSRVSPRLTWFIMLVHWSCVCSSNDRINIKGNTASASHHVVRCHLILFVWQVLHGRSTHDSWLLWYVF